MLHNLFFNINNERYKEITDFARYVYNYEIPKYKDDEYSKNEKIQIVLEKHNNDFTSKEEKDLFYLNLLANDNKKLLTELAALYKTYLQVDNMDEAELLKHYVKNGYGQECNIIIEYFMAYYELTPKQAYYKVNELIQYYPVIKNLKVRDQNSQLNLNTEMKNYSKLNVIANDEINLLDPFFEFSDKNPKTK